jgi:alkylation response protein AidB-like acyl-CoA dehydrogenase
MTERDGDLSNSEILFSLSDAHREVLDHADKFARNELAPLAPRMDAEEWWPDDAFPKIGAAGFFGVTVSPEYGGVGRRRQRPLHQRAHPASVLAVESRAGAELGRA